MGLAPIHATGIYRSSSKHTSNYVIPTYIPTLKALVFARRKELEPLSQPSQKLLIVTTSEMVDQTDREKFATQESVKPIEPTVLDMPMKGDVLKEMQSCTMVHFVCHGNSDPVDPSNGGLVLGRSTKNKPDHLTVRELAAVTHARTQIAYCPRAPQRKTLLIA
jgi:hypothetical protein